MIRLYASLALIAALSLCWWRYDSVVNERNELKNDLAASQQNLEDAKSVTEKERINVSAANDRAIASQVKQDEITNQVNDMRKCIDAGTCGVRWKYQACPRLPSDSAATSEPAIIEADAANRREFEQNYFTLLESIRLTRVDYESLQAELIARSDKDYCKAK